MFMDKTVNKIAKPGNKLIHQATMIRLRPSATIEPQAGVGGDAHRKEAKARLYEDYEPNCRVAKTTSVFNTLGNMCRVIMRTCEHPATRARAM